MCNFLYHNTIDLLLKYYPALSCRNECRYNGLNDHTFSNIFRAESARYHGSIKTEKAIKKI